MDIGLRIKERRKQLRMSADELARRIGKDRSTIYRYENGKIDKVAIATLEPLAKALKTTPAYLIGLDAETSDFSSAHVEKEGVIATYISSNATQVRHMKKWIRDVGQVVFTDEEYTEIANFAKYLLHRRTMH